MSAGGWVLRLVGCEIACWFGDVVAVWCFV